MEEALPQPPPNSERGLKKRFRQIIEVILFLFLPGRCICRIESDFNFVNKLI